MKLERIVTENNTSKVVKELLLKSNHINLLKRCSDKLILDLSSKIDGVIESILIEKELDLNTGYLESSYSIEGENIYYIDKDGNATRVITFNPINVKTSYLPNNDFNIKLEKVYY